MTVTLFAKKKFSILDLFRQGEQGAWYDPSDFIANWRRNLLTYTEQFDNAVWNKSNLTVSSNTTTAPNETLTAYTFIEDASASTKLAYHTPAYGAGTYKLSVYAKAKDRSVVALSINTALLNQWAAATFNLASGTVSQSGQASSQAVITLNSSSITSVGSGWYLCSITVTATASFSVVIQMSNTASYSYDSYGRISYTGNGTSGIYIWGAQLEVGSTATAYQQIITPEISYLTYQPQPVMFQNAAGTTPVTALEQPVGLLLDKSKGLVLGPELVTNGAFATDTAWTKGTGWTISGGKANYATSGTAGALTQTGVMTIGQSYQITFVVSGLSAGQFDVYSGFDITIPLFTITATSNGTYTGIIQATSTSIAVRGSTLAAGSIDDISVKLIAGNHASQTTLAARPVLSARYNLLTYTEQFDNAAWTKAPSGVAVTVSSNSTVAPDGTITADTISEAATTLYHSLFQQLTVAAGTSVSFSCYLKVGSWQYAQINYGGVGATTRWIQCVVDLSSGNITQSSAGANATLTSATSVSAGNGWYKVTLTGSIATDITVYGYIGTVTSGTPTLGGYGLETRLGVATRNIIAWGADLRVANDGVGLPPYQRVAAVTDYDSTGFPTYLRFDGVDDCLLTSAINFTATDKMTAWAGVRKLSDVTLGMITELSASTLTNAGSFFYSTGNGSSATAQYAAFARGTTAAATTQTAISTVSFTSPITNVLTAQHNISGSLSALRINGAANGTNGTGYKGSGNFGNYPLFIGRRNNASLQWAGQLYSLIVRGAQSTQTQITQTETWVNGKTKAY